MPPAARLHPTARQQAIPGHGSSYFPLPGRASGLFLFFDVGIKTSLHGGKLFRSFPAPAFRLLRGNESSSRKASLRRSPPKAQFQPASRPLFVASGRKKWPRKGPGRAYSATCFPNVLHASGEKSSQNTKKDLPAMSVYARYIAAHGEVSEMAEGARLEIVYTRKVSGVRISPSPPQIFSPLVPGGLFLCLPRMPVVQKDMV